MDPENLDVGVIAEEYGHAAFGLPDIYTTDAQASPSNWAIMEAGSWNGILGGMQPAPFPLIFKYMVGWVDPVELDLHHRNDDREGRPALAAPEGHAAGDQDRPARPGHRHAQPAGHGQGLVVRSGRPGRLLPGPRLRPDGRHGADLLLRQLLGHGTDYDYSYFEVSDDGGATWTKLPDMDGIFVTDGNGFPALNGEGQGTLRFDLSAWAGKAITLRLHYTSDVGVQLAGWFADDFRLADGATTLFSDDVENPPNGWTTNHFVIVPLTRVYPMYYMAEWRNSSGFDRGLKYAYTTIYSNEMTNEWQVDRTPYTVPGMLLWLRNAAYDFDYTLYDSLYDPPSYGPKHAMLVVDSHYWPYKWDAMGTSEAHLRLNSRAQPGNATFTLQDTTPFTASRSDSTVTGNIVETKTFGPLPPVSQFHDSLGYYPGLRYRPANDGLYFWDAPASLAVPATGNYTTKITWGDKTPATDLYGIDLGDTVLGSGDPRDSGVQYGINIAVLDKAKNGSWGNIAVWNATSLARLGMKVSLARAFPGQRLVYQLTVRNLGPAPQPFTISDPVPANTTWVSGGNFDAATNSVSWTGTISPTQTKVYTFTVKVNAGTSSGAGITNTATLMDDASGSSASATTVVK